MVAHFRSSVTGLDVGAPVRFRGIRVGTVSDIQAVWGDNQEDIRIPVTLSLIDNAVRSPTEELARQREDLDPTFLIHNMIQRGLRAELVQDSFLTGKLYVALDFYPKTPIELVGGSELLEVPTTDRELDKLKKSIEQLPIQELTEGLVKAARSIDQLVNAPKIHEILDDVSRLLKRVDGELAPLADSFRVAMDDTSATMRKVDTEFGAISADLRAVLANVDAQIEPLSASAQTTMQDVRDAMEQVKPVSASAVAALDEARDALGRLDQVFGDDSTLVYRLADALDEISRAAQSIRALAVLLERQPEVLVTGRER
jgi:paraquat-inducible protein B